MDPSTSVCNIFNPKPLMNSHTWHGYNLALLLSFAGVIGMVLLLMIPPGFTVTGLFKEKL